MYCVTCSLSSKNAHGYTNGFVHRIVPWPKNFTCSLVNYLSTNNARKCLKFYTEDRWYIIFLLWSATSVYNRPTSPTFYSFYFILFTYKNSLWPWSKQISYCNHMKIHSNSMYLCLKNYSLMIFFHPLNGHINWSPLRIKSYPLGFKYISKNFKYWF